MMSMTAFARCMTDCPWGTLVWELKSVNHRFCETTFRLPELFRSHEIQWRQRVSHYLSRGKVDLVLKHNAATSAEAATLDPSVLAQLKSYQSVVASTFEHASVSVFDVLAWPGVLQSSEVNADEMTRVASDLLDQALQSLVVQRQSEGQQLQRFFEQHLQTMQQHVVAVESRLPIVQAAVRERTLERFSQLQIEVDSDRLEQEMVWVVQKMDVAEEIERLKLHIKAFSEAIQQGGVIGRRLDFLAQELNREANTLASKSIDATVTHLAVELKVLIEQVREQVQNIE